MLNKEDFLPTESLAIWNLPKKFVKDSGSVLDYEKFAVAMKEVYQPEFFDYNQIGNQNLNHVIVGMNPGSAFIDEKGTLLNFHGKKRSADARFAAALVNTNFWGAFMTDLSQQVGSDSSKVKINNSDIFNLFDRLEKVGVGTKAPILAVGKKTYEAFEKFEGVSIEIKSSSCKIFDHNIYSIPHYSYQNNGDGPNRWNTTRVHDRILNIQRHYLY